MWSITIFLQYLAPFSKGPSPQKTQRCLSLLKTASFTFGSILLDLVGVFSVLLTDLFDSFLRLSL
jgi:hypothetical protein